MKKRIWELDVLRGICLIGIMYFHLMYDLVYLFGVVELTTPLARALYQFGNDWGGTPFLIISGVCVTLGARCVKRGLEVIGGGLVISAVTVGMYLLDFADRSIIIYFGVLHCIGTCMLLWSLFKKVPVPVLLVLGILLSALGLYWKYTDLRIDSHLLTLLGIPSWKFASSDYFPLLPNFGFFLLGACAGKTFYRDRVSLLPRVNPENFLVRFFSFFGKHSLIFYLLHQPVLAALVSLWLML